MYDIDEDLAKNFNAKKVAKNVRVPEVPTVEVQFSANLISAEKSKSPKGHKLYEFKFRVTKSNNELVPVDATYRQAFFPGACDVDNEIFWDKVTPLLMSVFGETNILTFDSVNKLGELTALSKATDDLGLGFRCHRRVEPCRPDKVTGVVKHKNPDGTPKLFPRDNFLPAAAE